MTDNASRVYGGGCGWRFSDLKFLIDIESATSTAIDTTVDREENGEDIRAARGVGADVADARSEYDELTTPSTRTEVASHEPSLLGCGGWAYGDYMRVPGRQKQAHLGCIRHLLLLSRPLSHSNQGTSTRFSQREKLPA